MQLQPWCWKVLDVARRDLGDQRRGVLTLGVFSSVVLVQLLTNWPCFSSATTKCDPERAFL